MRAAVVRQPMSGGVLCPGSPAWGTAKVVWTGAILFRTIEGCPRSTNSQVAKRRCTISKTRSTAASSEIHYSSRSSVRVSPNTSITSPPSPLSPSEVPIALPENSASHTSSRFIGTFGSRKSSERGSSISTWKRWTPRTSPRVKSSATRFDRTFEFGSKVAMQNSHAESEDQLHPLREVPRWTWSGEEEG